MAKSIMEEMRTLKQAVINLNHHHRCCHHHSLPAIL
jgi:hypothetical protein